MPNHIRNRITITGDQLTIDELKSRFSTHYEETQATSDDGDLTFKKGDNYGWLAKDGSFTIRDYKGNNIKVDAVPDGYEPLMEPAWTRFPDFNKVIPMPEELEGTVYDGLVMFVENPFSVMSPIENLIKAFEAHDEDSIKNFCKAIRNIRKYGHATWYSWAVENWATKWNAYECREVEGNVFEFDTAWSGVVKIISKIAESFPSLRIVYEHSSEDTGYNCAVYVFESGMQVSSTVLDGGSKEAIELAFKLRPEIADDYELVGDNYQYKEF